MELAEFDRLRALGEELGILMGRLLMNGVHASLSLTFANEIPAIDFNVGATERGQSVDWKRAVLALHLICSGMLLVMAIDIHITMLTICFALCGFWASHRLSSNGCKMVIPVLVILNVIMWREMYLALPFAALALALSRRFSVSDRWRGVMTVSALIGASMSILYVFSREILTGSVMF